MMFRTRSLPLLLGCSLLASCGGGGSGSLTGGGQTPTPTPTPTSSPTPTPTPVSYTKFADLTGDRSFKTTCSGLLLDSTGNSISASPFGEGITIARKAVGPEYRITTDGFGLPGGTFDVTFTQADRDTSASAEVYAKANPAGGTDRFVTFAPSNGTVSLEYARFAQLIARTDAGTPANFFCAFGVPTELNDSPTTNIAFDPVRIFGSITVRDPAGRRTTYAISSSTGRLTANPTTGEITTTITIKGREVTSAGTSSTVTDFATFTGTTTIDGSEQTFRDLLLDSSNAVSGEFAGWFFGPRAKEVGYSFNINYRQADGSDLFVAGVAFGVN